MWPHQREALGVILRYIRSHRGGETDKSALIQMPTGSGKSGVIAVASRVMPDVGFTLVLTPRKSLREQLYRDIRGRFFQRIHYPTDNLRKEVRVLRNAESFSLGATPDRLVLVMTIHMLMYLARKVPASFQEIRRHTTLLLVDEGHYEPAKVWSRRIRAIRVPKVIFTATPYRNDFKTFDIDLAHTYSMSLAKAQGDGYLRNVEVIQRPRIGNSPRSFAADIIDFYDSKFGGRSDNPPRMIIRCDNSASINLICKALIESNRSVVGIHENFKRNSEHEWLRGEVPNPEEEEAVFWVHQFKLIEGLDDSRFQAVAIFENFGNARDLVQQVGRIVRNPAGTNDDCAFLLDHSGGWHEHLWEGFLTYDQIVDEEGLGHFALSVGMGVLQNLIEFQPKIAYVDGKFRSQFDLEALDACADIQLPLKVNIFKKTADFSLDRLCKAIVSDYEEQDRVIQELEAPSSSRVILSVQCSSSPFLTNHTFMEAKLHVTVIKELADYVFLYDSSAPWSGKWGEDLGLSSCVDTNRLKRLFPPGDGARVTQVALSNSNLGTSAIRSRSITAVSIAETIAEFDDHAQICTRAVGYSPVPGGSDGAQYVGFSHGRVSQQSPRYKPLEDYLNWLSGLQEIIDGDGEALRVFNRYALQIEEPEDPEPRSILLDLKEVMSAYVCADGDERQPVRIADTCVDVRDWKFCITANEKPVEVAISFRNGKYRLESPDLCARYIPTSGAYPKKVVSYLNQAQAFRVLPSSFGSIYVHGQFYKPRMKVGSDFDPSSYSLGHCFVTDNAIGSCGNEKGDTDYYKTPTDDWDPDSLFGMISRCGAGTGVRDEFGEPDILVCDDMGTEIADFVMCKLAKPRVVFIHAKAQPQPSSVSASALHDVCAQAVKNLGYLSMYTDDRPSKLGSWDDAWSDGKVQPRIRRSEANDTAASVWEKIRAVVNNPTADKEVWLFMGNILSRRAFEEELAKDHPAPYCIQAAYLLHGTMAQVASVGAKLRIFCRE